MAESDYKPTPNCAVCGEGGPLNLPLTGLCDYCRIRLLVVGEHRVVFDKEFGRLILLSPVDSSNIARAGWRAYGDSGLLAIEFRLEPPAVSSNDVFRYANVSRDWWTKFLTSDSKGRFFYQTVRADKTAHPFTKIP